MVLLCKPLLGDTAVNKTDEIPAFMEPFSSAGYRRANKQKWQKPSNQLSGNKLNGEKLRG